MKKQATLSLSCAGLKNLQGLPIEPDFEFIVGHTKYPVFKLVAAAISPRIRAMLRQDPTMSSFEIQIPDPNGYFDVILAIAFGRQYQITHDNFLFVQKVGALFENDGLVALGTIQEFVGPNVANCLMIARKRFEVQLDNSTFVTFIAQHFTELAGQKEFTELPIPIIENVLGDASFAFTAQTYGIFKEILSHRGEFMRIFKKTVFKYFTQLSTDQLQDFTTYIDDDDLPEAGDVVLATVVQGRHK
jgi:hypothetical protein